MCMHVQLCLTLCDPMDCSPPDSSVHGILQARILDQAPPASQASSRGEAKDSALLSSRDAGLLEPPEREALARDGVSREVPCSALKGETVPDSLPATPKSPPTRRQMGPN